MPDVDALFREHGEGLFRYLLRFSGGDEDASRDAVQNAYLKLMEVSYPVSNPRAWLYRVATNTLREWAGRSRRREDLVKEHSGRIPLPHRPEEPDEALEREERVRQVRAALASLSEKERAVLLLREEGFRHREIAEAVGTTTGSVGTMIARALEHLASRLRLDEEAVR